MNQFVEWTLIKLPTGQVVSMKTALSLSIEVTIKDDFPYFDYLTVREANRADELFRSLMPFSVYIRQDMDELSAIENDIKQQIYMERF